MRRAVERSRLRSRTAGKKHGSGGTTGTWGDEPFIPSNSIIQSPEFGAGNPFNGGKIAMANTHMWYTCCIANAGETWDLAVIPTNADGKVNCAWTPTPTASSRVVRTPRRLSR